ncbi:threonine-rich protein [Exaiptasia diaphana]|uniref:Transmembrane protein n=1 Tax=Exaiptasia diaphana TaxID=2652724 RepID=A0A913X291_EXADI|nr:threonine-rich protein [Exaiptasia diaphana]
MAQFVDRIPLFLVAFSTLFPIIYVQSSNSSDSNSTTSIVPSPSSLPTSTAHNSSIHTTQLIPSTTVHHASMTSTHAPISPTSTSAPIRTSSKPITPTPTSTAIPTSSFANFTTPQPTTAKPTAHPADCHTCQEQLKSERHYKWAAVAFDVILAIALVIMTIMYLRQRKMYREMEGDGSLSRLI